MKLNYLLSVCVLALALNACNEQPKNEAPVVVETQTEVIKEVVVEKPVVEKKVIVEKEEVIVEKEKDTKISIGSKGASLKTKKVDIQINE